MNETNCTIGGCERKATRRLEIRIASGDEHPADVRPLCDDAHCETIARQTAAGFDRRIVGAS